MLTLIVIKTVLIFSIAGYRLDGQSLLIRSVYDLVSLSFDVFIVALFIQAILSWVSQDPYHPVSTLLHSLTLPILRPIKKLVPSMGGLDLSTLIALIGLMFIKRVVLSLF